MLLSLNFLGILWGATVIAMDAPKAAMLRVLRRSTEQVSKMLTLRGSSRKQLLLVSLKHGMLLSLLLTLKLWEIAVGVGHNSCSSNGNRKKSSLKALLQHFPCLSLSLSLSIYLCPYIHLSLFFSLYLSDYLSINQSIYLSTYLYIYIFCLNPFSTSHSAASHWP